MKQENLRILLIEDNMGDVRLIAEMITEFRTVRCNVEHAFKLATGLELLKQKQFDLILLDLGLPDSMGLETLKKVHANAGKLPIVIMTGHDDEELGIKAVQLGAQDYLVKIQIDSNLLIRSILYAIERKKAEEARLESEATARAFMDGLTESAFIIDTEGKIIASNETAARRMGQTVPEFLGTFLYEHVPVQVAEERKKKIEEVVKSKVPVRFEDERFGRIIDNIFYPILGSNGEITRLAILGLDITERKNAEAALQESEQRLSTIFRQSPSAVIILTLKEGVFVDVNEAFQAISGYSHEEVVGKKISSFGVFFEESDARDLSKSVEAYKEVRNLELNFTVKNGHIITGLVSATRMEVKGEPCMLIVVLDITERKKALEQIKQYVEELQKTKSELEKSTEELFEVNKKLNELNASKDKFFSIVAHDLRSPFTALLGFSEYLSQNIEELTHEEIQEFSLRIYKSLNSLLKLIENLLQWSRVHTGRMDFTPSFFDMDQLVEEIIDIYQVNAAKKKIKINNYLSEKLSVYADRNMLNTVVRNLLSNAIKFTPAEGTVNFSAREEDGIVELEICDTGVGINAEELSRLFKIDETISTEGTDNERGTGLGLILCKEFIEINGGRIWVESKVEKGSKFKFTLPKYPLENRISTHS